ncbi:putative low molecular weight protein-tyrosine-phosphatase AmsI [Vibrio stylophorae]|uniref:protein-tyrosine-phosphatase n=2 Tax=Vibrio stylophorae TaxID=659351 RepID=A0ABM8ZVP6_9VIBR|nr:putative low molecular weight protein-tyrosine-phosphatase AmsI [Vibrio stylophorae]
MVGKPADPFSIAVSIEHGVNLNCHRSQQLTEQMCQEYDLILVMEKGHISAVTDIAPTARGKTMLLGQWIGPKEIPDPYRQSKEAFDFAYQLIDQASSAWVEKLK